MPKHKDLKRLTRARMEKTGESYTTARARLVQKRQRGATPPEPPAPPAAPPAHAALAGMSDDAVRAKTGRTWGEWVAALDAAGAAAWPHRDIADHLRTVHAVPAWWSQMVTVGYERIRGLRDVGQRRSGGWEANKSKTVPVRVGALYRAFEDEGVRRRWLPVDLVVRTARRDKSMRITWEDGTSVDVYFTAKGTAKSQVAVQHRKLAGKAEAERARTFWHEHLEALSRLLVSGLPA